MTLRSLVVLPNLPRSIRSGVDLRSRTVIDALCRLGPVAVFGVRPDPPSPPPSPSIERWDSSTDSALATMEPGSALRWLGNPDGSLGDAYFTDRAGEEVAELQKSFRPDLVVIEALRLHRYLDMLDRSDCSVVVDSPDVESALQHRIAGLVRATDRRAALLRGRAAERMEAIEAMVFADVDRIWVCSDVDAAEMESQHSGVATDVVPNTVDLGAYDTRAGRPERLRVVFPATFAYPPNEAAAITLIDEVMPRVREVEPAAELVLVGSHAGRRLVERADRGGAVMRGVVPDIAPELAAATVMAVPLTVGSGTRYKLLEAFASGLPVVTSRVGAEGLLVRDGVHALLAESPSEVASAIVRVWTEPDRAAGLASAAHDLVRRHYSYAVSGAAVAASVNRLARIDRTRSTS